MEALLEKEGKVESWNDERMNELNGRVDAGFKEMREGFAAINARLDRIPTREEIDHRFEAAEGRIDRVSNRLEHLVWGLAAVGGGLLANLLVNF
ncbi:MAG TPA: hypothetical protein VG448_11290 [Solirubrobacterales bacterium]|nr:hypothetical protein [Solirubrobacterales bacterium]